MTVPSDQRQVTRQLRRTRSDKPARFRREAGRDYPAGYLAQLARPLLSRKAARATPAGAIRRPPTEAATG
jgi:hypothetical protein